MGEDKAGFEMGGYTRCVHSKLEVCENFSKGVANTRCSNPQPHYFGHLKSSNHHNYWHQQVHKVVENIGAVRGHALEGNSDARITPPPGPYKNLALFHIDFLWRERILPSQIWPYLVHKMVTCWYYERVVPEL